MMQYPTLFSALSEKELVNLIEQAVEKVLLKHLSGISNSPDSTQLLTRKEAAAEFQISLASLDNYRNRGLIVPRRLGGSLRYQRGDLQAAFSGNILNPYKVGRKGKRL